MVWYLTGKRIGWAVLVVLLVWVLLVFAYRGTLDSLLTSFNTVEGGYAEIYFVDHLELPISLGDVRNRIKVGVWNRTAENGSYVVSMRVVGRVEEEIASARVEILPLGKGVIELPYKLPEIYRDINKRTKIAIDVNGEEKLHFWLEPVVTQIEIETNQLL